MSDASTGGRDNSAKVLEILVDITFYRGRFSRCSVNHDKHYLPVEKGIRIFWHKISKDIII
jgi:hypothetical protein